MALPWGLARLASHRRRARPGLCAASRASPREGLAREGRGSDGLWCTSAGQLAAAGRQRAQASRSRPSSATSVAQDVEGEADDVVVAAVDAGDEEAAGALDAVGAGLVERLAGGDVPVDARRRSSGVNVTVVDDDPRGDAVGSPSATTTAVSTSLVAAGRGGAASTGRPRRRRACPGSRRRARRSCRRRSPPTRVRRSRRPWRGRPARRRSRALRRRSTDFVDVGGRDGERRGPASSAARTGAATPTPARGGGACRGSVTRR